MAESSLIKRRRQWWTRGIPAAEASAPATGQRCQGSAGYCLYSAHPGGGGRRVWRGLPLPGTPRRRCLSRSPRGHEAARRVPPTACTTPCTASWAEQLCGRGGQASQTPRRAPRRPSSTGSRSRGSSLARATRTATILPELADEERTTRRQSLRSTSCGTLRSGHW